MARVGITELPVKTPQPTLATRAGAKKIMGVNL